MRFAEVAGVHAAEGAGEIEVALDRHVGVEGDGFRQIADELAGLAGVFHHVEAADGGGAAGGGDESGDDAHGGGLAGAIGAEESHGLPLLNLEGDVLDGVEVAVGLGELGGDNHGLAGHPGLLAV